MTHAALKDLLPCPCGNKSVQIHSGDSSGKRYVCCNDGDCHFSIGGYSDEQVRERWNRRTLSAMEGEAVIDRPARVAGRDFVAGALVQQVLGRAYAHYDATRVGGVVPAGYDYAVGLVSVTAPPPQQADQRTEGDLADKVWTALDKVSCPGIFMQIAVKAVLDHAATHPTPSPGPLYDKPDFSYRDRAVQESLAPMREMFKSGVAWGGVKDDSPGPRGGGEAEIRWVIGSTVFGRPTGSDALAYANDNWCAGSETDCRIPKLDKIRAVFATPPAHQPGEVGRFDAWWNSITVSAECPEMMSDRELAKAAWTAALAPKEDGHG